MLSERPKNYRYVGHGLHACGLPRRKDVLAIVVAHGIKTVIDLTQRERSAPRNACRDVGVRYIKQPTPYDSTPAIPDDIELPALVFCFHGRDRTGRFIEQWLTRHAAV